MKALPKRKGNREFALSERLLVAGLKESPSEKEGKCPPPSSSRLIRVTLNESPSEKEGK